MTLIGIGGPENKPTTEARRHGVNREIGTSGNRDIGKPEALTADQGGSKAESNH